MPAVISVPSSLDDQSFEQVFDQLAAHSSDEKLIVDARQCTFVSPFGLTALLALAQTRADEPTFLPPQDGDVANYWARAEFFRHAHDVYAVQGAVPQMPSARDNDVLLEVTRMPGGVGIDGVLERIHNRALRIFNNTLHLEQRSAIALAKALSEACQSSVDRAGSDAWVMVQTYHFRKRLGGRVVVLIAVCNSGVRFRRSLESSRGHAPRDCWDDPTATEAALGRTSGHIAEPGTGQELQGITGLRECVSRLDGNLSVRSGTARTSLVPRWDDDIPRMDHLAPFPGTQLQVIIPGRAAA